MSFTPYPNQIYTTFSFFGFIMCIIPLPWHFKAWNVGTCLYMVWTGMGCFVFFINSIVWRGNAFNLAPVWCDICAKIIVGASIGIPASSLCINRRLYKLQINPVENATITTKSEKSRVLAADLGISVGLPMLIIALDYISQGHRFDIYEDIGCYPATYNTWISIITLNLPPVLVGLVSASYGIRTIISVNKRRKQFDELLSRQLNVSASLYYRLMCFAGIEALLTVPISGLFVIYNLIATPLYPWISWEDTHSDFQRVDQWPAIIWHEFALARVLEFARWTYIICAILFFSFFGFAEEARHHYRLTAKFLLKAIGIQVGRQSEIPITFRTGPVSKSNTADCLTFANKSRVQDDSFSTISAVSEYPDSGRSEEGSPSGSTLRGTQDCAGSPAGHDSPTACQTRVPLDPVLEISPRVVIEKTTHYDSLISSTNIRAAAVTQENELNPGGFSGITLNLRSFLSIDYDPSTKHASASTYSSQMDISTIEEGQPSEAKRRSSSRISRQIRSFLNFD